MQMGAHAAKMILQDLQGKTSHAFPLF